MSKDVRMPRNLEDDILGLIVEAERDGMSADEMHATLVMILTAVEEFRPLCQAPPSEQLFESRNQIRSETCQTKAKLRAIR